MDVSLPGKRKLERTEMDLTVNLYCPVGYLFPYFYVSNVEW